MQSLALYLPAQVERLNVRITRVINESGLIAVEHAVKAQGKEFTRVALLNLLFPFLLVERVIHIE